MMCDMIDYDDIDESHNLWFFTFWILQVAVGVRPKDSKVWVHPESVRKTTCYDQSLSLLIEIILVKVMVIGQ